MQAQRSIVCSHNAWPHVQAIIRVYLPYHFDLVQNKNVNTNTRVAQDMLQLSLVSLILFSRKEVTATIK